MTLYLWSHWFWITLLFATISSAPIGSVDTVSSKLLHNSRDFSKREPLKFPVAVQSDTDDIFDGGPGQENLFKTEWFPQPSSSKDSEKTVTILKNKLLDVTTESLTNLSDETNTTTKAFKSTENITQTVDYKNESSVNIKLNSTDHVDYSDEQFLDEDKEDGPGPSRENDTSNENERGRQSKKILADYSEKINLTSESKSLLARSAAISVNGQEEGESEAFTVQDANILDAGAISGICFAVIGLFCGVSFAVVAMYRRRYLNTPQTLSEPDSSGYIDDSTIRDNSDEMYSLDNDSFLNSLEAMTIQNYWTDSVKHTKL